MIGLSEKRNRYMLDPISTRLGGIAANLARINSFSSNEKHSEAVSKMMDESRYFIEWTASDFDIETQDELVQLQLKLSIWIHTWDKVWFDFDNRSRMAKESSEWSMRLLKISGII